MTDISDDFSPIKSERPSFNVQPDQAIKLVGSFLKTCNSINSSLPFDQNIDHIKKGLLKYCNIILTINGQSNVRDTNKAQITNIAECAYLGTKIDSQVGCKVSTHLDKKRKICDLLTALLLLLFEKSKIADPRLLADTDLYIKELYTVFELYCHFIGKIHYGPIYVQYVENLVNKLNLIFDEPLIYIRCLPDINGYGCARMITKINRKSADALINKSKILVISMNNSGDTSSWEIGTNFEVEGGTFFRKFKKNKRLSLKKHVHNNRYSLKKI
jgi:hypothetical protein